jgi:hypothetical protein
MIARITKTYTRRYSDNGMVRTYVEWVDHKGRSGCTEGTRDNDHMHALLKRGAREGAPHTFETW